MADKENVSRQYDVGYRRPPRSTQFKKGQSGNPKGRPKGSLNFSSLIEKELKGAVVINENGVRKRISKKQAIAKQLVNKAATGDYKAIPILISEERSREAASPANETRQLPAEDHRVLKNLIARIRGAQPVGDSESRAATFPPSESEPKPGDRPE